MNLVTNKHTFSSSFPSENNPFVAPNPMPNSLPTAYSPVTLSPSLTYLQEPVFQNSAEGNNSDTSESVAFSKIQKNLAKTRKIRPKRS
jgi:hypothetical protein